MSTPTIQLRDLAVKNLKAKLKDIEEMMLTGRTIETFDDYRKLQGRRQSLVDAIEIVENTASDLLNPQRHT